MAKVTGIGGVFIKSTGDGAALAAWYQTHLGIALEDFGGAVLNWQDDHADDKGLTVWSTADSTSDWFAPSTSSFMINYRVDDLAGLLEQLKTAGVAIVAGPERHENGDFAWIMDPEGNKVELWEPMLWDDTRTDKGND
ncbi:VOC family protein [Aliiroseovarius sp. S1339]|uniref:VOC family protein n=1 Tax=Aliiroseovarius sp. S1339 TaxID=2936990 RepID=UPI0020BE197B|nr:VOC family protein [Aliiroseovarius sp. S1339]MCK8462287.1 VOC family protein [Aliiroseovarius sp. S1339]